MIESADSKANIRDLYKMTEDYGTKTAQVAAIVGAVAFVICLIALLVILKNYLRFKVYGWQVLSPNVVAKIWEVAKWTGVISASCLGVAMIAGLIACRAGWKKYD